MTTARRARSRKVQKREGSKIFIERTTIQLQHPNRATLSKRILHIFVLTGFTCLLLARYFAMFNGILSDVYFDMPAMATKVDFDDYSVTKFDDVNFNDIKHKVTEKLKPPRKFFAIHIGPSKTGTSTIQADMAANPFESNTFSEDKDNVIYVGKRNPTKFWQDPNEKKTIRYVFDKKGNRKSIVGADEYEAFHSKVECCIGRLQQYYNKSRKRSKNHTASYELLDTDEAVRTSLREQFISDCWKGGNVDFSYMLNYSIVDSKEGYSHGRHKATTMGKTLFQVFDILGYERLIVVGAYRRYAEWIVSAYGESLKQKFLHPNLKGVGKSKPCTPLGEFLQNQERRSGKEKFGSRFYYNLDQTLPAVRATAPPKLEVKMMNYFQLPHSNYNAERGVKSYDIITTEMYCDILEMPYTCKNNLEIANSNTAKNAANAGSTATAAYQQIVAYGYLLGYLLPNKKERVERLSRKEEKKILTMLDKITKGGKTSIVGTSSSNITMYKDLSVYHTTVHKANPVKSLPYICPGKQQLENILERSLKLEKKLMPEFYASPLGEEEHKRLFWDVWFKEKKIFCWVDIERLFQNAQSWDEIINHRMVNIDWDAENGGVEERK